MFIYFRALSPVCYMRPMCRWEGFSDLILSATPQSLHLNAYFCSILLITVKKNREEKAAQHRHTRRNSHLKHRAENDSDMH